MIIHSLKIVLNDSNSQKMSHKSQLLTLVTGCYAIKLVPSTNTIGRRY